MNNNYNDIIDIILTLQDDSEIIDNIAVSGSIVPYLVMGKESLENHTDFYILVKNKKINNIRNKIKELSREYDFEIVTDSKKYSKEDYGFKIKYQSTVVGFFPYSLIDNNLTIKTYAINKDKTKINLKKKVIPEVSKSSVIRLIKFGNGKLRIMSPEYILADKETRERQVNNPTDETIEMLGKIVDPSVLKVVRNSVSNTKVKMNELDTNENNAILVVILVALVLLLMIIAYICFKK